MEGWREGGRVGKGGREREREGEGENEEREGGRDRDIEKRCWNEM